MDCRSAQSLLHRGDRHDHSHRFEVRHDSGLGEIFVFDSNGKYQRTIGRLKGGEGYFKRPTGIAVDSQAQRIYVTDTLRDQVFVLDMKGAVLETIGKSGSGNGEFNLPTELHLDGQSLLVLDAMNFRVQVFDRSGNFQYAIGKPGDTVGSIFRPKAMSIDSEDHLYLVDAEWDQVQIFDREGRLPTTSAARVPIRGNFSCRQDCSSITTTKFT